MEKEILVKELVELIVKSMVDNTEKVQVFQLSGESSAVFEIKVAPEDMGKVIGRQGKNAQAIRTILGAAGMKMKKKFSLDLIEAEFKKEEAPQRPEIS
jgi:predicted RNA-binding protein YlqC (UPF0109 family)